VLPCWPTLLNKRLKEMRKLNLVDHKTGGYAYTSLGEELAEQLATLDYWSKRWAKKLL